MTEASRKGSRNLIAEGDIYVATSVLLETEWVLRSAYGLPASRIMQTLRSFAGLPGVALENPSLISRGALDWADGAWTLRTRCIWDARGIARSFEFDRKLAKVAAGLCDVTVVSLSRCASKLHRPH